VLTNVEIVRLAAKQPTDKVDLHLQNSQFGERFKMYGVNVLQAINEYRRDNGLPYNEEYAGKAGGRSLAFPLARQVGLDPELLQNQLGGKGEVYSDSHIDRWADIIIALPEGTGKCPACARVFASDTIMVSHLIDKRDDLHEQYRIDMKLWAGLLHKDRRRELRQRAKAARSLPVGPVAQPAERDALSRLQHKAASPRSTGGPGGLS